MKTMIVTSKIYLCVDSFGNKAYAVCEDSSDTVQLCGLKDKKGDAIYFESDAYHIYSLKDDGVIVKVIDKYYDFDKLFSQK